LDLYDAKETAGLHFNYEWDGVLKQFFPECLYIPFFVTYAKSIKFKGLQSLNWSYLHNMFLSGVKESLGERN